MTGPPLPSTGLAEIQALRPRLFGIAYRMLGSPRSEAYVRAAYAALG